MGRNKLKRTLRFKPKYKAFSSHEGDNKEVISLLHEELEALYLMDSQELYQADAAKQMGISRPTFATIIKNARQKITMMLITGASLKIVDEKDDLLVMIPSESKEQVLKSSVEAKFLLIYHLQNKQIIKRGYLLNPIIKNKVRPAQVLPTLCSKRGINFFMSESIGLGLKSALLSKGIYSIMEKEINEEKILGLSDEKG